MQSRTQKNQKGRVVTSQSQKRTTQQQQPQRQVQSQAARGQSATGARGGRGKLPEEDLAKLKVIGDLIFMDQYKDTAGYPRFEECFGTLVEGVDLPSVFKAICGKRRKYITFRRLIASYSQWKTNPQKCDKELAKFYEQLTKKILKKSEEGVGKVIDGAINYNTRNSQNRFAISQLCVITDETQEIIKGLQIFYDDFFKNNLFLNQENEKFFVSLELNLAADTPTTKDAKESFPKAADRDGITHVGGTIENGFINFLLFKCRSGKTSFVGKPSGEPFLFGEFGKQLQTAKVAVKDGKMCYFQPQFMEVQRSNPNLNKKPEEVTDAFLGQDKPIYEETILVNSSDKEAEKNLLNPCMKDDRFFNADKHKDKISGTKFNEIANVANRFVGKVDSFAKKFNINLGDLINQGNKALQQRAERMEKLKSTGEGPKELGAGGIIGGILNNLPKGADGKFNPKDFLQNAQNFEGLLGTLGGIITKDAEKEGKLAQIGDFLGGAVSGLSNLFGRKDRGEAEAQAVQQQVNEQQVAGPTDDGILRAGRKQQGGGDKLKGGILGGIGSFASGMFGFDPFAGFGGGSSSSMSILSPFADIGGSIFSIGGSRIQISDNRRNDQAERRRQQEALIQQQMEEQRKKISQQELLQRTRKAQANWQNFKEKYAKDQGIFVIQTIGAVIKALTLLKNEEMGIPSKYTLEEKLRLFNILKANREIIVFLTKAHKEAQRRQAEQAQLQLDQRELQKMKEEEQKRQAEEKKRLEEENKRREEEKRISQQQYLMEQEQKRRQEEQKRREQQIQQEKDAKKKAELQKIEEQKRKEEEKKRQQEAQKQKELEEQKKKLEEEKRKAEAEQKKKEEEERKKREAAEKAAQEAQKKKQQEEEAAKKKMQEQKVLKESDLPEINARIQQIDEYLRRGGLTAQQIEILKNLRNELMKDRNAITEKINEENEKKIAQEMGFDPNAQKKAEEEERRKQKEAEDKAIEEKKRKEEEERKQKTVVVSTTNAEIPKDTQIWRGQKLAPSGEIYTDELFQPVKSSLCPVNDYGKWQYPEDITAEDLDGWEKIKWQRAENIFGSKNYQVFYEGIKADDIIQGGLGDCYFLSAVAALCKFPTLIERLFFIKQKSNEHCYGCYYRVNGIWKLVLVDDYIPCYGSWGYNFAFSSTNGNELWVILLEKAWAKLNGSYAKSIGGEPHEVFEVITNAYSEKIRVKKGQEDQVWNKLLNAEKNGFIMTAGTSGDTYSLDIEQNGLVPGHAYTILGVKEVNTSRGKTRLVHIRNPWGNGEWSGNWSDSSSLWTSALKQECGQNTKKDDGSFWMSFEDFCKYYLVVGICNLHEGYHYTSLHVPKSVTKQGPYITKIQCDTNNTHAYIMLHQKNPRIVLKNGNFQKPVVDFIMLVDKDFNYVAANNNQDLNVAIEVKLNKGIYYLISDINFRFVQSTQHCYNLSAYASNPVGIFPLSDSELKSVNMEEAFKHGLLDYSKKNLSPQDVYGAKLYQSKRSENEFPFMFCLLDNPSSNYDVTLTDTLNFRSSRCADYYFEGSKDKSSSLTKTIKPGQYDVFCHMPYNFSSSYSYGLKTSVKQHSGGAAKKGLANPVGSIQPGKAAGVSTGGAGPQDPKNQTQLISQGQQQGQKSTEEITREVFNEQPEPLDQAGYLKQYIHQEPDGYYIGFENSSTRALKLKLVLEGLYDVNNPNSSSVPFTSNARTRKVFLLKPKPGNTGNISFIFENA